LQHSPLFSETPFSVCPAIYLWVIPSYRHLFLHSLLKEFLFLQGSVSCPLFLPYYIIQLEIVSGFYGFNYVC
jgi:hypothetical protein